MSYRGITEITTRKEEAAVALKEKESQAGVKEKAEGKNWSGQHNSSSVLTCPREEEEVERKRLSESRADLCRNWFLDK